MLEESFVRRQSRNKKKSDVFYFVPFLDTTIGHNASGYNFNFKPQSGGEWCPRCTQVPTGVPICVQSRSRALVNSLQQQSTGIQQQSTHLHQATHFFVNQYREHDAVAALFAMPKSYLAVRCNSFR